MAMILLSSTVMVSAHSPVLAFLTNLEMCLSCPQGNLIKSSWTKG